MGLPPEDDDFRRAVAGAQPLANSRKVIRANRPPPVPRQRLRDERAALAESMGPVSLDDALDSGDELAYLGEGLARSVLVGQSEARNRALNLLVCGSGFGLEEAVELNRLRRAVRAW